MTNRLVQQDAGVTGGQHHRERASRSLARFLLQHRLTGRFLGLVSNRDVLARSLSAAVAGSTDATLALRRLSIDRLVEEAAPVTPDESLERAAARLIRDGSGCLPVVEFAAGGPRLLGIVTETDLLRAAYGS